MRDTPITNGIRMRFIGDTEGLCRALVKNSNDLERQLADHKEALEISNRSADDQMMQKREAERQLADAREQISDMEIRHAATMMHTQTIVDEAIQVREQRDRLADALTAWNESLDLCECDYGCDGRMPLQGEKCAKCRLWDEVLAALAAVKGSAENEIHSCHPNCRRIECVQRRELKRWIDAVRNLHNVQGRHNTQIAMERLFSLLPENEITKTRAQLKSQ